MVGKKYSGTFHAQIMYLHFQATNFLCLKTHYIYVKCTGMHKDHEAESMHKLEFYHCHILLTEAAVDIL